MAGIVTGFYNDPNIKRKVNIRPNNINDPLTDPVAEFIGETLKDTAISTGQVLNEGFSNPLISPIGSILGKDFLANQVSKINPEAGKSMRGEVTPTDIVNVASLIPIPVGGIARGGLMGLKLAAKGERLLGRGAFTLGETASKSRYKPSFSAKIAESTMRNPITANYLNNAPELALNAPALINTWKSDAPIEEKLGVTSLILAGTSAGGIASRIKLGKARRAANKDTANKNPASALIRAEAKADSSYSDITMAMDTGMPLEGIVALSASQPGYRTKYYASLYENDMGFRRLIDDFNAGKVSIDDAQKRAEQISARLGPSRGLGIKRRNWEYWANKKNTGSFVKDPRYTKLDTLFNTLTGNPSGTTIPWDTKEIGRAKSLLETENSPIRGRPGSTKQKYIDWYFNNVLLSDNPWVLQSARERLYGASGVSDINIK